MTEPTEWLPSAYQDEVVPHTRESPTAWLVQTASGAWAIEDGEPVQGTDPTWVLVEGEVVEFDYRVDLASGEITITLDEGGERHWTTTFDANVAAPPGTSLTVWGYSEIEMWPSLQEAAFDLDEGTHKIAVYAWSYPSIKFRFTEGRFERVRVDA